MTLRVPTDPPATGFAAWARKAANAVNQLITGKQDLSDNLTSLSGLDLTGHSGDSVVVTAGGDGFELSAVSGGSGISDGDYGDVTASLSGTVLTVDNDAITYAKMQNVSATDKLLGRSTAGAGDVEEIACTAAGRALLDDANAAAQRTTLGLGTLATQSGTFSGTSSGTNTGDQTSVSGNAGTATALQTARTINGVSFDGTANIVVGPILDGAKVRKAAALTAQNVTAALTAVTFGSEDWDTGNYHSNVTNSDRITPAAGYQQCTGQLSLSNVATGSWVLMRIERYNSSAVLQEVVGQEITEISATATVRLNVTGVANFASGDFLRMSIQTESDTSTDISTDTTLETRKVG